MLMVAHFHLNHNRPLNKHIIKICLSILFCSFFAQFKLNAQTTSNIIPLVNPSQANLISNSFKVYKQRIRVMEFEEFSKARTFLPYSISPSSNYGFEKNGVWLYTRINNLSDLQDWVLTIRFSQLQEAKLYIRSGSELIYQGNDGMQNKTSPFALPSFLLNLPSNQTLELYIYVRSSSMSLVAPVYMQGMQDYSALSIADYSIWGFQYGIITLLFIFAATFFAYNRYNVVLLFAGSLIVLLVFGVLWSGHAAHMPSWVKNTFIYLRAESVIMIYVFFSTVFTLIITPVNIQIAWVRKFLIASSVAGIFFSTAFLSDFFSPQVKLVICYFIAFSGILANTLLSARALMQSFFPARALLIGWGVAALGSIASASFLFGALPNNLFHQHIFNFSLVVQACAFLLAIILRKQYDLELVVKEAQTDAENNFLLIEEQNIHLDIARKQAIKAYEVKSQFLANMSHEIRTPLNAIMGFTKELESNQNIVEREEHIRIINSSASDLLTIVNDVLDFSKMEAGKLVLNNKPFSPRYLLEDVAALMSKTAHLKQLEFILDIEDLPSSLIGDSFKIKQLLSNLLSNALKFTNFGYISLRAIVVDKTDYECSIEFQIEDTGIGISDADMGQLFTAFHQLDDDLNRSFQGTGLGLVICQELVSLMNGQIKVSSEANAGSLFVAKIPFQLDETATQLTPVNKFTKQTAVLIDAWPLSCKTSKQQLVSAGFDVLTFASVSDLSRAGVKPDFVFVSLPLRNNDQRPSMLEALSTMNIFNLVLLYSGPVPNTQLLAKRKKSPKLIRLPLTSRKLIDINQSAVKAPIIQANPEVIDLPKVRILAVDDMELNLRLIDTWLKPSAVTLDLAFSGEMAISFCNEHEYDLILMDIQMPNMDGLETTRHIRKIELNIGVPIIAVTAHALETEKQHFLDSGMDDFLSKPIDLNTLSLMIKNWCHGEATPPPDLPVSIDWDLALKRANNNKNDAISFLDSFMDSLQVHSVEIEQAWQEQRKDAILTTIHKLHGACCYTGVPRLQGYCYEAEDVLKHQALAQHSKTVSQILLEIEHVMIQWPALKKIQS